MNRHHAGFRMGWSRKRSRRLCGPSSLGRRPSLARYPDHYSSVAVSACVYGCRPTLSSGQVCDGGARGTRHGPADRVSLGAHQRLGHRLDHPPQQIRLTRPDLFSEPARRAHAVVRGHRVITLLRALGDRIPVLPPAPLLDRDPQVLTIALMSASPHAPPSP